MQPFQPAIDKIIMEIFLLFKNKVVELWKFYPVSHCASTTSHASADLNEKNKGFLFSVYRLTGNS
nr:MAG TPA: hypothetical protein [Caudoviricetes sp.]